MSDNEIRIALLSDALVLARKGELRAAAGALSGLLEMDFDPDVALCAAQLERGAEGAPGAARLAIEALSALFDEAKRAEPRVVDSQSTTRPPADSSGERTAGTPVDGARGGRHDGGAGKASDPLAKTAENHKVTAQVVAASTGRSSDFTPAVGSPSLAPPVRALDADLEDFDFAEAGNLVSGAHLAVEAEVVQADVRVATPIDPAELLRPPRNPTPASVHEAPTLEVDPAPPATPPHAAPAPAAHAAEPRAVGNAQDAVQTGRFAPVPDRIRSAQPTADLVGRVRHMLGRGDLASASQLVRELLEIDPTNAEAAKLNKEITAKLSLLRRASLAPLDRVPRADMTRAVGMHPRSMYLLSRIDGQSTLEDIIDMSGMPSGECAELLSEMIEAGVLRF